MEDLDSEKIEAELKAFDDTKAGVKGLVDSGITKVPRIFHQTFDRSGEATAEIPTIDLGERRREMVEKVRGASETWGFFQVVNHGVPLQVLEEMLRGTKRFFELDTEAKQVYYTRDPARLVRYNSSFDLFRVKFASWRDSLFFAADPLSLDPNDFPVELRDIILEYSKQIRNLGSLLLEVLSEALGLEGKYLRDKGFADGLTFLCHYSPACPEPELTLCTSKHSDGTFFTVLLQDLTGGLQVLHSDRWIDVVPVPGALVVNIGDLLQLISNGKFVSVEHRVLSSRKGPRLSVACFFRGSNINDESRFGPIKELITENNPPKYRETTMKEFVSHFNNKGLDGTSALSFLSLT